MTMNIIQHVYVIDNCYDVTIYCFQLAISFLDCGFIVVLDQLTDADDLLAKLIDVIDFLQDGVHDVWQSCHSKIQYSLFGGLADRVLDYHNPCVHWLHICKITDFAHDMT